MENQSRPKTKTEYVQIIGRASRIKPKTKTEYVQVLGRVSRIGKSKKIDSEIIELKQTIIN